MEHYRRLDKNTKRRIIEIDRVDKVYHSFNVTEEDLSELSETYKLNEPVWGPSIRLFSTQWFLIYSIDVTVTEWGYKASVVLVPLDVDNKEEI